MAKKRKTKAQKIKAERSITHAPSESSPIASPVYSFESSKSSNASVPKIIKPKPIAHPFAVQDLKKSVYISGIIVLVNLGIFLLVSFGIIAI